VRSLFQEPERVSLQARLDAEKTQADRNRLGQFATPTALAHDIVLFAVALMHRDAPIRFLDPAFGTGSFFSALLAGAPTDTLQAATGFELDAHYGEPARQLWHDTPLTLHLADFTRADPPTEEQARFNLIVCNPPYVRHHHIPNQEKPRLKELAERVAGVRIAGLAGLYCYFLCLSHPWMQSGGIAAWLIPSEFMDVKYGEALKRYLLNRVTLLRIHRFDPHDVQFDDALVSSAVVCFRNDRPPLRHEVDLTFGGSLLHPKTARTLPVAALRGEHKWARFPASDARQSRAHRRLSDLFTITRGVATGANKFFILSRDQIDAHRLPSEFLRPILPSPRYVPTDEIHSDRQGLPIIDRQLFLLDCRFPETEVKDRYPHLWEYLETGRPEISERYLCRHRKVWYFQERREPAPILFTYLGRTDTSSPRPFRFILNHSKATAANVYLLLYPKPALSRAVSSDQTLMRRLWEVLNSLSPSSILREGRVYGGGLHKLEPKELGNVDATPIIDILPELHPLSPPTQPSLFRGGA
jgi:adenine-specific DNA-methyltransferase